MNSAVRQRPLKSKNMVFSNPFRVILFVLILWYINVTVTTAKVNQKEKWKEILSRKKRYLIFTEGSSLQLGKQSVCF